MPMQAVVVDDAVIFRRVVAEALELCGLRVVATAANGRQGVQRILELKPEVVTLDVEMPEMDGLQVLEALREARSDASVLVLSGLTSRASQLTLRALERGAFDFICKPATQSVTQSRAELLQALRPRLSALARRREIQSLLRPSGPEAAKAPPVPPPPAKLPAEPAIRAAAPGGQKPALVLVGVSTGGPNALGRLLPGLPGDIGVPILVVQHMPALFTASLAESLAGKCAIRVREAKDQEPLEPNTAYIAPGGRHMRIAPGASGRTIQITDDPPEHNCRPAVDYLFRSAANHFPGPCLAVILTGMGNDGTLGLRLLKRRGCPVIAQDEATCVVYGMPRAAVEAGVVDVSLPIEHIAARICACVRGGAL